MAQIGVHYGKEVISVTIPDENLAFVLQPSDYHPVDNEYQEVLRSLHSPIGTPPVAEIVKPKSKVVIIADDLTRLTPQHLILPPLLDELNYGGVADDDVHLVIATGSHRDMTTEEIEKRFGKAVTARIRISNHDYHNNLIDYGVTKRNTRILINRSVMEADLRIGVGMILPHYPAGWAGGAKILLPGVAGQETIAQMHLLGAMDPKVRLGKVITPCREEMEEFAEETGLHFIVNAILNQERKLVRLVSGHYIEAHREGVHWGQKMFGSPFSVVADLTISSSYPIDYDFFQADKGLFSASLTTRDGGEILLCSPCHEGISPAHSSITESASLSLEEILDLVQRKEIIDPLAAIEAIYLKTLCNRHKISLLAAGLPDVFIDAFRFERVVSIQEVVDRHLSENPSSRIGVIHQSAEVLPQKTGSDDGTNVNNHLFRLK